tara:strand:- start:65 stop:490 length:426 start_codon:yes stop_codon:yes gene_type:complete
MLILNRGRIVAEGTLQELQSEYLDKTVFEVVAGGDRSVIEKIAKDIDPLCELTNESLADATGRKRFSFCTQQGESSAQSILKALVAQNVTQTREFIMARPDLESIFLKATKRSWEQTDSSRENLREVSATPQPEEEEEEDR